MLSRLRARIARLTNRHDEGFTLVELVISVAILGAVMTAIVAAMTVALKTNKETGDRLTESRDLQFASTWFGDDVQGANTITDGGRPRHRRPLPRHEPRPGRDDDRHHRRRRAHHADTGQVIAHGHQEVLMNRRLRAPRRTDDGASLLITMAFVMFVGLVAGALLSFSGTSVLNPDKTKYRGDVVYDVDRAMHAGINQIRNSKFSTSTPPPAAGS